MTRPVARVAARRDGVVYTIIAVMLLIIIANIFFTQTQLTTRRDAAGERVRTVNQFIDDLGQDSERAAYIAGFRTLIAMEQHITTTGEPIPQANVSEVFREIFLAGSYRNTSFIIMQNATFNEYLDRVRVESGKQGIRFNATVTDITLWQTDPWTLLVNYTLEGNITDSRGTANWTVTRTFTGRVPIVDLRDPLYTTGTYGRIQRVIKRSNVTSFVSGNDTAGLQEHMNRSMYIAAGRGPDILMRFAGNRSDSEFGIESLVNTDELTAQNLEVDAGADIVDYKYFGHSPATRCHLQNLTAKFRFDGNDSAVYGTGGLDAGVCP